MIKQWINSVVYLCFLAFRAKQNNKIDKAYPKTKLLLIFNCMNKKNVQHLFLELYFLQQKLNIFKKVSKDNETA